jgi:ribose 5-phosphate isomerase B
MLPVEEARLEEIIERVVRRSLGRPSPLRRVALGSDHRGFPLKELLKEHVNRLGYEAIDCGVTRPDPADYPVVAESVAARVRRREAWRGIVIDGAGIGSCMAANKVPGIRAALCYNRASAVNSVEHNDANVLALGSGLIGPELARSIVEIWLETRFAGGRHARRVDQIAALERRWAAEAAAPPAR